MILGGGEDHWYPEDDSGAYSDEQEVRRGGFAHFPAGADEAPLYLFPVHDLLLSSLYEKSV